MNILFLAHRIPYPPTKGDKIRSFHEIRFLSQSHQISLLCLADDENDLQYSRHLEMYCHSVDVIYLAPHLAKMRALCYLASKTPLSLPYFFSKKLQAIVDRKIQEEHFDLIFVYSSSMAQYVEHVHNIPRVMDFVDIDSDKWSQYAEHTSFPYSAVYRSEGRRLRAYEALIADSFDHSFLVSPKEAEDFRALVSTENPVSSINNGIDMETFTPSREPYEPNRLAFVGAMDYFANVETMVYFVREILPFIQQALPEVILYIVGSKPSPEIGRLAEHQSNIIVTGFVDDIQPYVKKAAAFVAPMRIGRGINNKILESMAMGVPVVSSSIGFEGIPGVPGEDLFVEDEPEAFARQVVRLMQEPDLRRQLSLRGRQVVESHCAWESNLKNLETILLQLVQKQQQTRER